MPNCFYAVVYEDDGQKRMGTILTEGGDVVAAVFQTKRIAQKWLRFANSQQGKGKYQIIAVKVSTIPG